MEKSVFIVLNKLEEDIEKNYSFTILGLIKAFLSEIAKEIKL